MAFRRTQFLDQFYDAIEKTPGLADLCVTRFDSYVSAGAGRGDTIHIPALSLPAAVDIVPGSVTVQEVTDGGVNLKLTGFKGHTVAVTNADKVLNDPGYMKALLDAAALGIKDALDTAILALFADASVTQEVNTGTPNGGAFEDGDILTANEYLTGQVPISV